jgi:dTDP-4-amino-4,6-dideoxygalactose transaminase
MAPEEGPPAIPVTRPWLPDRAEYHRLIDDIFDRHWLSNFAKYAIELESRAVDVLGHEEPLSLSSCDVGLMLSWRALGLHSGEVIVPSYTFASTVNAIRWNGLTPVFADIDPDTLTVDIASVERLITGSTVGICAVHTFGRPADIDRLEALARERGLKLVFDAAHAVGGSHDGEGMGTFGDISVFSLSGTKLVTAGEGGLIAVRDPEIRHRMRLLRNYGFIYDYDCVDVGMNGKISEMNAALGWLSLGRLKEALEKRVELIDAYRADLDGVKGIHLQAGPEPGDVHTYKDFAILFASGDDRRIAEEALTAQRIQTKRYFLPVHYMRAYSAWRDSALPVTDDVYDRVLCLPVYHDLTGSDRARVVATILGAL